MLEEEILLKLPNSKPRPYFSEIYKTTSVKIIQLRRLKCSEAKSRNPPKSVVVIFHSFMHLDFGKILLISDLDKNFIDNLKKDHFNLQVTQAQVIIHN